MQTFVEIEFILVLSCYPIQLMKGMNNEYATSLFNLIVVMVDSYLINIIFIKKKKKDNRFLINCLTGSEGDNRQHTRDLNSQYNRFLAFDRLDV